MVPTVIRLYTERLALAKNEFVFCFGQCFCNVCFVTLSLLANKTEATAAVKKHSFKSVFFVLAPTQVGREFFY